MLDRLRKIRPRLRNTKGACKVRGCDRVRKTKTTPRKQKTMQWNDEKEPRMMETEDRGCREEGREKRKEVDKQGEIKAIGTFQYLE